MTIHKTLIPRTVGVAAAAALFAGLASTGVAVVQTASTSGPVDDSMSTVTGTRYPDVIALRPDPADPSRLVVDFGISPGG
jgi:hypothetical protein